MKTRARVVELVAGLDDADSIEDAREGVVLDRDGARHKLKTHHYRPRKSARAPDGRLAGRRRSQGGSLEELHARAEAIDGPLDTAVLARRRLLALLQEARELLETALGLDDAIESIRADADSRMRTVRFALRKNRAAYDDERGALALVRLVAAA